MSSDIINNIQIFQVAENKTLDRERQSVLRLEIEAADTPSGGADKLKTTATILVDVLDVDDNSPEFEKSVYTGETTYMSLDKYFLYFTLYFHTVARRRDPDHN